MKKDEKEREKNIMNRTMGQKQNHCVAINYIWPNEWIMMVFDKSDERKFIKEKTQWNCEWNETSARIERFALFCVYCTAISMNELKK